MLRRISLSAFLGLLLLLTGACTNKKVKNPLANLGSKQPDKVLFDRAMDAMKHNRFDVSRMALQTLINTYPDSEFIARAKLAEGDSWYAEGGNAALTQAELVYKDFITFFPNMPEAAEAQLKIANIHYQQMEKPDRDFTHAMRAEDEYRQLILQFPDSKLVPEAKQRLLEVQEVLANREFMIGRFYYLRQAYPAAIARLQSVADRYPLFSRADDALYMLGQSYEGQIANIRASRMPEASKAKLIEDFTKRAAEAYSKILTRYPVMARAADAEKRLVDLRQPVPKPTKAAVALNQQEEDSRHSAGMFGRLLGQFSRHPDVAAATKVGDPTMTDPKPVSATDVVQAANRALLGGGSGSGDNRVSVETVKDGAPQPNEAAPRSDAAPGTDNKGAETPTSTGGGSSPTSNAAQVPLDSEAPAENSAIPELKPNLPDSSAPLPPPSQVNEIQTQAADGATAGSSSTATDAKSSTSSKQDDENVSSSKKKKRKHKLFPF